MQARALRQIVVAALCLAGLALWATAQAQHDGARVERLFGRVVVAPGDDPTTLPVSIDDAHLVEIDRHGALWIHDTSRVRRQPPPRAYQELGGGLQDVAVRFDIPAAGAPRFIVGPYDRTRPLIIDAESRRRGALK